MTHDDMPPISVGPPEADSPHDRGERVAGGGVSVRGATALYPGSASAHPDRMNAELQARDVQVRSLSCRVLFPPVAALR